MIRGAGCIISIWLLFESATVLSQDEPAPQLFRQARAEFEKGQLRQAAEGFRRAASSFGSIENSRGQAIALFNLATVYHSMGQNKLAFDALDNLRVLTIELGDPVLSRKTDTLVATVAAFSRKSDLARGKFESVLKSARAEGAEAELAQISNDFGSFLASEGEYQQAKEHLDRSIQLSEKHGWELLRAKAILNRALLFLNAGLEQRDRALKKNQGDLAVEVAGWLRNVRSDLSLFESVAAGLPDSAVSATLMNSAGEIYKTLIDSGQKPLAELTKQSFQSYNAAIRISKVTGSKRSLSHALGGLAKLYEDQDRLSEALQLSRAALNLAQEESLPDSLFQWEWQCGRLLAKRERFEEAVAAYRRAGKTLEGIRHDVAIAHGKRRAGKSFREAVGPLYFELAGLLVQKAKSQVNAKEKERLLFEARDVIEEFKSAELEDFFQDDCINLFLSKTEKRVEDLTGKGAVFYLIPLKDKTHVLVNATGKMHEFQSALSRSRLMSRANQLRESLENQATFEYIEHGQVLYNELIRPVEKVLQSSGVETLIFVPDGELRTVPLAAFHDGKKFLVERYSIAVTPGLRLLDSGKTSWNGAEMLVGALTESVDGYPALAHVAAEAGEIGKTMTGSTIWLDQKFRELPFVKEVQAGSHRVVHIASHGEFGKDSKNSFVLTHDGKIDLDELEQMIKPRKFDGSPVDLLVLSACRTAVGDDRAALGLAGVAVKSGARGAIASLWYVDDEITSQVMRQFYRELTSDSKITKAEALRRAQLKVIDQHPCYWSPFLVIGNWL